MLNGSYNVIRFVLAWEMHTYKNLLRVADSPRKVFHVAVSEYNPRCEFDPVPSAVSNMQKETIR
jgi:hypothetical protein